MASTLRYVGLEYPSSNSYNGQWDVDITVRFSHTSPTDGFYSYKIRYWYWDETANGTYSGDFNSGCPNATISPVFLSESAGTHSGTQSHDYTISLGWTAGHIYKFGFEILYNVSSWGTSSYQASSLGAVNQTITVKAANEGGSSSGITNIRVTPGETTATIKFDYGPTNSNTYYTAIISGNGFQSVYTNTPQGNGDTIELTANLSNLSSGTPYHFNITMKSGVSPSNMTATGETGSGDFTTSGSTPEPTGSYLWSWNGETGSWNYGFGNVSSALLQNAYDAITGHGATTDFHHTVWNDMLNCVDMGMTDCGFGTNLGDCYMNTTDKVMTRHRFRSLVNHINALADYAETSRVNSELSSVVRGDAVYGWYFVELMQKYNTAINTIFPM